MWSDSIIFNTDHTNPALKFLPVLQQYWQINSRIRAYFCFNGVVLTFRQTEDLSSRVHLEGNLDKISGL